MCIVGLDAFFDLAVDWIVSRIMRPSPMLIQMLGMRADVSGDRPYWRIRR